MAKGILKVSRTNKGRIFVEIDRQNGKPPMPFSYIVLPDLTHNGKECEFSLNKSGQVIAIEIEGTPIWKFKTEEPAPPRASGTIANPAGKFADSLSLPNTFLPKDVRTGRNIPDIDNFALKLHKAARYQPAKDSYKFLFYKNDSRDNIFYEIKANYGHLTDHFDTLCKRQDKQAEGLFGGNLEKITLTLQGKMALGLGNESVYETSMTLHDLYGFPYLPASALKGVLRSWVISQVFAQPAQVPELEKNYPLVNAENRAIRDSRLFCLLFGCPKTVKFVKFNENGTPVKKKDKYETNEENSALRTDAQGIITFFDALPNKAPIVRADVMNVHYKDWYKELGYQPPTDTQRTNPVNFLTVSPENGLQYQTYIGTNKDLRLKDLSSDYDLFIRSTSLTGDSTVLELVAHWLTAALTQHGLGAKTAVGYGLFNSTNQL